MRSELEIGDAIAELPLEDVAVDSVLCVEASSLNLRQAIQEIS